VDKSTKMVGRVAVAYIAGQVITGIELGMAAATVTMAMEWPLPAALGVLAPLGLPLAAAQTLLILALMGKAKPVE